MSLSKKTLDHPVLVLMIFVLLGAMGIFTIGNVAISLFPDVDNPMLFVSTSYPNAGPQSVEKSVTKLLESSLISVNNLEEMTSVSSEGSSTVGLKFAYGTDLEVVTNEIRDKLDRVKRSLPDECTTPNILKFNTSSMPIIRIALRGNRSTDELKSIAEDTVADMLEQASGVANASVMGGRTSIVRVELEQNRLQAYGLTLSSIAASLATQNLELGGGSITEGKTNYSIRTIGEYTSIEDIKNTVVTTINGYGVKVQDLGNVYLGYTDKTREVYINGTPGVYIQLTKQSGENSVSVANAVYKKIDQIKQILPNDVQLEIISDDTVSIRDTISTLIKSAMEGLILAVIILFIFLCNFKSTIIIAISIPLSIIITLLCMNFAGLTLNMMTLTGLILGVGMIVDASIVMIDNINVYRSRGAKPKVAAILGSQEMLMSVISGNLTTICVFIPFLFFVKDLGFIGQMFKDVIFTVVISLVSSLFVAILLVPVLAGKFLPLDNRIEQPVTNPVLKSIYGFFNKSQDWLTNIYSKALKAALNHKAVTVVICLSALIMSFALLPTMKINMMPGGGDDSVTLSVTLPIGTSLEETTNVLKSFEKIVEDEVKGYDKIITTAGSGGRGFGGASTYQGNIQIRLPEASKQIDNSETIKAKLRKHFSEFTDVTFSFGAGMRQQMSGADIDIVLRSDDLDLALDVAKKISGVMKKIDNIGEPSIDIDEGLPQVEISIDRDRAYNFGVNVSTVANEINACIEGKAATVFRNAGKEYTVYVMLQEEDRNKVVDLEQIFVNGTKGRVCVANFAKVEKGYGPVSINRENQTRIIHLTAEITNDENANVVENKIKEGIAETFIIPDDVTVSYEGSWGEMGKQAGAYFKIILMAIILVFGVMAATYESFKAPFINLMTIPFIIIGIVFIYKITNQPISLMSAIGIIMLVGIVVNNGIILVDYTNLLRERGMELNKACYEAGRSRFRPVLMTTLTTILGMIPMCFATSGSAGMVQPIGVACVGGLTSSTLITLFFIPVLYSLMMKNRKHKNKKSIVVAQSNQTQESEPQEEKND